MFTVTEHKYHLGHSFEAKKTGCEHKTATFKPTLDNCKSISSLFPVLPTGATKIAPSLSHAPWRIRVPWFKQQQEIGEGKFSLL
jgi:hypothetical protein